MVELEDFKYGGTNITAFRLVDPDLEEVQSVVQDWIRGEMRFGRKLPFQGAGKTLRVSTQFKVDGRAMKDSTEIGSYPNELSQLVLIPKKGRKL